MKGDKGTKWMKERKKGGEERRKNYLPFNLNRRFALIIELIN
jgi:hypothetical protein